MTIIDQSKKQCETSYSQQGHYCNSAHKHIIPTNSGNTGNYFSAIQGQQVGPFGGGLDNSQVFPKTSNGQYYQNNIAPMVQGAKETYDALGLAPDTKK